MGYSYPLVVINSYPSHHAAVLLLYATGYSRGCGLVSFYFLVCSLMCRTKRGGTYHKCIAVGLFVQNFFFELAFLTLGSNTSSW